MKNTAFTWRIHHPERKEVFDLLSFMQLASDTLDHNEKSEVVISYLPVENLIRFMVTTPGEPSLTHILLCELDETENPV
jgi:hypothetical protein